MSRGVRYAVLGVLLFLALVGFISVSAVFSVAKNLVVLGVLLLLVASGFIVIPTVPVIYVNTSKLRIQVSRTVRYVALGALIFLMFVGFLAIPIMSVVDVNRLIFALLATILILIVNAELVYRTYTYARAGGKV
jgi:hypothetical protein